MIFSKIVITNFKEKLRKILIYILQGKSDYKKMFVKSLETGQVRNIKVALFKI